MNTFSTPISSEPLRVPIISGARNFRDIGGYQTVEGKTVRWGKIYRSGSLAQLTPTSCDALREFGVRSLCDLRTTRERKMQPFNWRADFEFDYWSRDYETSFGELRRLLEADLVDGKQARAAMLDGYRKMPLEQAPAYRAIFSRLINGTVPLVFCCSAGKDRTGIGAALILTALGVPREIVIADYVLTDSLIDLESEIVRQSGGSSSLSRQPAEVVRAILGCDAAYIAAALDVIAPTPDAFKNYLYDVLNVDTTALENLRAHLLE